MSPRWMMLHVDQKWRSTHNDKQSQYYEKHGHAPIKVGTKVTLRRLNLATNLFLQFEPILVHTQEFSVCSTTGEMDYIAATSCKIRS